MKRKILLLLVISISGNAVSQQIGNECECFIPTVQIEDSSFYYAIDTLLAMEYGREIDREENCVLEAAYFIDKGLLFMANTQSSKLPVFPKSIVESMRIVQYKNHTVILVLWGDLPEPKWILNNSRGILPVKCEDIENDEIDDSQYAHPYAEVVLKYQNAHFKIVSTRSVQ